jgi:hypothetical protein
MSSSGELSKQYEIMGQDPQLWLEQAKKLKLNADLIRGELEKFIQEERENKTLRPFTDPYRIVLLAYVEGFMMLTGMAFENLIKGIDVAADDSLVSNGKLNMSRWKARGGHDLSMWATNAKLSQEKINLLARLEEYSVWAGRYPVPTNSTTYVKSKLPDNKQSFAYPTDFNLIDELFNELSEKLVAVWRVKGATAW